MQILFTSTARRNRNRRFGLGILKGRKPAKSGLHHGRLPIGPNPSDSAWLAAQNVAADPTDTELLDELEKRTLTAAEYRDYLSDMAEIAAERWSDLEERDRYEEQELSEAGITSAYASEGN